MTLASPARRSAANLRVADLLATAPAPAHPHDRYSAPAPAHPADDYIWVTSVEEEAPVAQVEVPAPRPARRTDTGRRMDVTVVASWPALLPVTYGEDSPESWKEQALCAETDPEAFFPEKGGSTREAKKVCTGCDVKAQCLEYALANDERFGIWGGLSERERRRLKRQAG